jgi:hypothetical protein
MANNYVYFILDNDTGLIKIGQSRNPQGRLTDLKEGHKNLVILGTIRAPLLEKELHARFAHLRVHGEWFKPDNELAMLVNNRHQRPDLDQEAEHCPLIGRNIVYFWYKQIVGCIYFRAMLNINIADERGSLAPSEISFSAVFELGDWKCVGIGTIKTLMNGFILNKHVNGHGVEILQPELLEVE